MSGSPLNRKPNTHIRNMLCSIYVVKSDSPRALSFRQPASREACAYFFRKERNSKAIPAHKFIRRGFTEKVQINQLSKFVRHNKTLNPFPTSKRSKTSLKYPQLCSLRSERILNYYMYCFKLRSFAVFRQNPSSKSSWKLRRSWRPSVLVNHRLLQRLSERTGPF